MLTPNVQQLVADLQSALGLKVVCGSITLNLNAMRLQSVRTETYQRIEAETKSVDKRASAA